VSVMVEESTRQETASASEGAEFAPWMLVMRQLDRMDRRMDHLDARVDQLAIRIDQVNARIDRLDEKFSARMDQLSDRMDRLDDKLSSVKLWAIGMVVAVIVGFGGTIVALVTR